MNWLWAPLVVVGLSASATAGGLACSRSSLQPARPDGSPDGPVSHAPADGQVPADGQTPADAAPTDLPSRSNCGNGRLDPGEQCDDGNTLDGDGCTRDCKLDTTACGVSSPGCPPMRSPRCGNGILTSDEACDDGNAVSGDGCSADCMTIEAGFRCPSMGRPCIPICGDGLLVGWESQFDAEPSCDPGHQPGSVCGDGIVTRYEECDCGNAVVPSHDHCMGPNDDSIYGGCTTKCTWGSYCGDGIVNGPEECDLGSKNGTLGRGGCTLACRRAHYCGDGILDTSLGEECDLGDLNGVRLDQQGKPSNDPEAWVLCHTDCTIGDLPI